MAQAISNKVLVQSNKYCWMVCDYSMSGSTMTWSLSFYFEGGCAQLDNAWIKVGNTTIWSNGGRIHNYEGVLNYPHSVSIASGTANISGTQTVSFGITKYSGTNMSGSFTVTGGSLPSGNYINYVSSTWNSITATTGVANGGTGLYNLQAIMVTSDTKEGFNTITADNWTTKGRIVWSKNTGSTSATITMRADNYSDLVDGPMIEFMKGMRDYYLANWALNTMGGTGTIDMTRRYTPPAPSVITYTDPGGTGSKTYTVSFVGDTSSNNSAFYDREYLTRNVRYKIGSGAWVDVVDGDVEALDTATTFTITIPADNYAVVEGWMTYHGMRSETSTVSIVNGNMPVHLYGSVNGQSKDIKKLYGSVNGETKKITKLYASVNGVTKRVFEDV